MFIKPPEVHIYRQACVLLSEYWGHLQTILCMSTLLKTALGLFIWDYPNCVAHQPQATTISLATMDVVIIRSAVACWLRWQQWQRHSDKTASILHNLPTNLQAACTTEPSNTDRSTRKQCLLSSTSIILSSWWKMTGKCNKRLKSQNSLSPVIRWISSMLLLTLSLCHL